MFIKKLLSLTLLPLSVTVSANNLLVDDTGAYFKKGVTIGSDAAEEAGTIRFNNGEFEGFDGEKWTPLASGQGEQTQRVGHMETLPDHEVQTRIEKLAQACSDNASSHNSPRGCVAVKLYNSDTGQTFQTNFPINVARYGDFEVINKHICQDHPIPPSAFTKYEGTDFNFYVNGHYNSGFSIYDGVATHRTDLYVYAEHKESGGCFSNGYLDGYALEEYEFELEGDEYKDPATYVKTVEDFVNEHIRLLDAMRIL